ncbi:MAG: hypothetical protein VCA73_08900 [Roseibacillus sp.]|jgi:hypothetical protein
MNRRRTTTPHLGLGSIVLLIAAAVVMASAGIFYAYIKNRQINVSREIQRVEDRISQHRLDIATDEMLLAEQLNPFLIRDRLKGISSDLRAIPLGVTREISARAPERPTPPSAADLSSAPPPDLAHRPSPVGGSAVAGGP